MATKRSELPPTVQQFVSPRATKQEVKAAEKLYETGVRDGVRMSHGEILSMLEQKYIGPDAPARGTPKAQAILDLAHEIGNHLREKIEATVSDNQS